jgi:putative tryptophan/tyrosine transport system substrate-binding protein
MKRREFIAGVGCATVWPARARAQKVRPKRVILISALGENDPREQEQLKAFRDGLSNLGWNDGQNVVLETQWSAARAERAKAVVAEIARDPPDVVVAGTLQAFFAMRQDASQIAMVFTNLPDPVGMGFVKNLARPDGNFTGFTAYEFATAAKWLEVLRELAPRVTRVAMVVGNTTQPVGDNFYRAMQASAGSGVETSEIRAGSPADVQAGIEELSSRPNGGLIMAADAGLGFRSLVIELAARYKLPAIYPARQIVDEGGLAFYGINFTDLYRGAAIYVDRVLRGTKPSDLPIQAPTTFQLVINRKVAKALDLQIPISLLGRADELVE